MNENIKEVEENVVQKVTPSELSITHTWSEPEKSPNIVKHLTKHNQ